MTKHTEGIIDCLAVLVIVGIIAMLVSYYWGGKENNHHEIVQTYTDNKEVVCFMLLDKDRRPVDMSCVNKGDNKGYNNGGDHGTAERQARNNNEAAARVHGAKHSVTQW